MKPEHVFSRTIAERIVTIMNEALAADPNAIQCLVGVRLPCNRQLADHPTIQVGSHIRGGEPLVGLLGILNGIAGLGDYSTDGAIVAVFDERRECRLVRFDLRPVGDVADAERVPPLAEGA